MATVLGALFIVLFVLAVFVGVSLLWDALNSCIRAANALERIANALEDDEEAEGSENGRSTLNV